MVIMSLVKHSVRALRKPCERCGVVHGYKGHDTSRAGDYCQACGVSGRNVYLNSDLSLNLCGENEGDAWLAIDDQEATPPRPDSTPTTSPDAAAQLTDALKAMLGTPAIDRAEVERIAREVVAGLVFPTRTVVVKDGVRREVEGSAHERLGDVVTVLSAGLHVMMVGPAGTGKSTIAHQAAEALGLPFYSIPCNPQMPASQLMGYKDATGNYRDTPFRQAFEHGGVFLFDEIDNSNAPVLASMNGALANGHMTFPDGLVKRHPDFRAVGAANTYGHGATRQYVGRTAIDGATLDRFAMLTIEVDETLETTVAMSLAPDEATAKRVLTYVRRLRRNAKDMQVILSPRATFGMCQMLSVGMTWDAAVSACVRKGMESDTWAKVAD